jgi:hypothetical protein
MAAPVSNHNPTVKSSNQLSSSTRFPSSIVPDQMMAIIITTTTVNKMSGTLVKDVSAFPPTSEAVTATVTPDPMTSAPTTVSWSLASACATLVSKTETMSAFPRTDQLCAMTTATTTDSANVCARVDSF